MTNSTTKPIDIYNQIIQAMGLMTPANRQALAHFINSFANHKAGMNPYANLTPTQRKMELIDVLARMKSHSITLSQFFCRLSTKRDALAALEREIASFQELIALVRLDVESELEAMSKEVKL
jgi:hypothetical protein